MISEQEFELRQLEDKCYHRYLEAKREAERALSVWTGSTKDLLQFLAAEREASERPQ